MGVSRQLAEERLALQADAAQYAQALHEGDPEGFVEVEVRHRGSFKVLVFYTDEADRSALTAAAPVALRRYLAFQPVRFNRSQVEANRKTLTELFRDQPYGFGITYSYDREEFTVTASEAADIAALRAVVPSTLRSRVTFETGPTIRPVAAIYGGWWYKANTGADCTTGWPVLDSGGQPAILTAGHCGDYSRPLSMYFSWQNGPTLNNVSSSADEKGYWQTKDYAFFRLGTHTTARVINVQNGMTFGDGSRNYVPGIVTAYYEIGRPQQPYRGQWLCKQGASTLLTCGTVEDTQWSGDGYANVVKVTRSAQPYIALGGDSGGPSFTWSTDGSLVLPVGMTIGSAYYRLYNADGSLQRDANGNPIQRPCKNTSTTASYNTTCYFVFLPLTTIRAYSPFRINTVDGFITP